MPKGHYLISAVIAFFCSSLLYSHNWWFFCPGVFEWSPTWRLKTSSPSCPCEASLMAFVCMHILYLSGGSSSAHIFSCHRWKRLRDGERTTISLLWRYFLYRCTSSNPQPLVVRSKPPERKMLSDTQSKVKKSNKSPDIFCKAIYCCQVMLTTCYLWLPMLMKSDLYWHVIPKPKSRQNPDSFRITWTKPKSKPGMCWWHLWLFIQVNFFSLFCPTSFCWRGGEWVWL